MGLCLVDPFSNPSMYAILACRQTPGVGNIRITWRRRFCVCRTVFSIVSGVWLHTAVRLFEGRATRIAKQCCLSVGFVHKHATKLDDVRIPFTWTVNGIHHPHLASKSRQTSEHPTLSDWRQRDRGEGAALCDINAQLIEAEVSVLLSPGCSPVSMISVNTANRKRQLTPFVYSNVYITRGRQRESGRSWKTEKQRRNINTFYWLLLV